MKLTKIENLTDWMKDEIENVTEIRPMHELAMMSVVFECHNRAIYDFDKYTSITHFIDDNCMFSGTNLIPSYDDVLLKIDKDYYIFNSCYVTKNNSVMLVANELIDGEDEDENETYFLVEGV